MVVRPGIYDSQEDQIDTTYGKAIYYEYCEMWTNGPTQWEGHKISHKHRKNKKRKGRITEPACDMTVEERKICNDATQMYISRL